MNIDWQKIDIKSLLKNNNITLKDFSYDYHFKNGDYMVIKDKVCGIIFGFGKKTKSKTVGFLEVNENSGNSKLTSLGSPYLIGDSVGEELILESIYEGGKYIIYNNLSKYELSISNGIIEKIIIHQNSIIKQNSFNFKQLEKFDLYNEAVGSDEIKQKLVGNWKFSSKISLQFNNDLKAKSVASTSEDEREVITYEFENKRKLFSVFNDYEALYKIVNIYEDGKFDLLEVEEDGTSFTYTYSFEDSYLVRWRNDGIGIKGFYKSVFEMAQTHNLDC